MGQVGNAVHCVLRQVLIPPLDHLRFHIAQCLPHDKDHVRLTHGLQQLGLPLDLLVLVLDLMMKPPDLIEHIYREQAYQEDHQEGKQDP